MCKVLFNLYLVIFTGSQKNLPHSTKEKFPNVRCIVDCIEFKVAAPSSLTLHKCCTQTTKAIPLQSGLFNPDLWEPGNELMTDHGFTVEEYLTPLRVKLIIPLVFKERSQFNEQEIVKSQQIANERIHVEKMIQQLKCYHTFDKVIPLNMTSSLNQIISVCGILSNFKEPILNNSYTT